MNKWKMATAGILIWAVLPISVLAEKPELKRFENNSQQAITYKDVYGHEWYATSVSRVTQIGLMSGRGDQMFAPKDQVTVAEAIAIAARIHHVYNGGDGVFPVKGGNWYDGAVEYALEQGIVNAGQFTDYQRPATRAEVAELLVLTLGQDDLPAINQAEQLPDVSSDTKSGAAIMKLFRAGVVSGTDAKGTFQPQLSVTRAEVSSMIIRIVDPTARVHVQTPSESLYEEASIMAFLTSFYGNFYDYNVHDLRNNVVNFMGYVKDRLDVEKVASVERKDGYYYQMSQQDVASLIDSLFGMSESQLRTTVQQYADSVSAKERHTFYEDGYYFFIMADGGYLPDESAQLTQVKKIADDLYYVVFDTYDLQEMDEVLGWDQEQRDAVRLVPKRNWPEALKRNITKSATGSAVLQQVKVGGKVEWRLQAYAGGRLIDSANWQAFKNQD